MVDINSLSFDLTNCTIRVEDSTERRWTHRDGVAHLLKFAKRPPPWPFDLTDVDAAREFYGQQCASVGGAMLSLDVIKPNDIEVLSGLFKYHAPIEGSLAMYFVGILWIPFADCNYQLNIEALERGTTGIREAVVLDLSLDEKFDHASLHGVTWPKAGVDFDPIGDITTGPGREKFRQTPLFRLPSDDEQFDALFPEHPLSLVRERMARVTETLKIDKTWLQSLKPMRIKPQ
jgi:hypothetical protein